MGIRNSDYRTEQALVYIRVGAFSGSALSLLRAFESRVSVIDFDLLPLARKPSLAPALLKALLEARGAGPQVPWARTVAWSVANQRHVMSAGLTTSERPVVFAQTTPAFVLDRGVKYGIYTDRVAREGAACGGVHASRFTAGWLEREEAFLRGAYRIYVMGPSTSLVLKSDYGIPGSKIMTIGAGPNAPLGAPVASESCRTFLFVGTQWELKGGPELLSAFADVRRDFPDITLLLVGSHPEGPVPEGVTVIGRVPHAQMDALYSQADALVIPTHMEAFGIALAEGLMKGLPCVGTTVGNQSWIIEDAGECVEPGQVAAISTAMRNLILDYPKYRERALERGRQLRETFQWDKIASTILEDLL